MTLQEIMTGLPMESRLALWISAELIVLFGAAFVIMILSQHDQE